MTISSRGNPRGREIRRGCRGGLIGQGCEVALCECMGGLLIRHAHAVVRRAIPLDRGRCGHLSRVTASILVEAVVSMHHGVWILHHAEHITGTSQFEKCRYYCFKKLQLDPPPDVSQPVKSVVMFSSLHSLPYREFFEM